jgi:hypothetical protein
MKRVKEGEYMCFLNMYEHGTLNPIELILRRGVG